MTGKRTLSTSWAVLLAVFALATVGCRQDMQDQPYLEEFEVSTFFDNGSASQQPPAGTMARGFLRQDNPQYWYGRDQGGQFIDQLPADLEMSRDLLERGQQRFDIYCGVCHDATGGGRGMIVRRGFKQPQPLYEDRLKAMPLGYFFDVMTNGFGIMPSYSRQVTIEDRWAIASYIRVLQLSQGTRLEDLPSELQTEFEQALIASEHADASHGAGDHGAGDQGADDHGEVHH